MLHAMIMAGGGGTRFWPRSRQQKPKQFLTLVGDRTLLQQALDRIEAQVPAERTWVITGAALPRRDRPATAEPAGRPHRRRAVRPRHGGLHRPRRGAHRRAAIPTRVMLVMPADHVIEPVQEFRRAVHVAEQMVAGTSRSPSSPSASADFPATGYGYIHRGAEIAQRQGVSVYRVAAVPREAGRSTWPSNSSRPASISGTAASSSGRRRRSSTTCEQNQPKLAAAVERIAAAWDTPRRDECWRRNTPASRRSASTTPSWRRRREVLVVQAPFRWDDVGSWLALERMHPQDADGNTVLAKHLGIDTHNCVIVGDADKLIATARRQRSAHHPGRRRHPGRRPPRRRQHQAAGRAAEDPRTGEISVKPD